MSLDVEIRRSEPYQNAAMLVAAQGLYEAQQREYALVMLVHLLNAASGHQSSVEHVYNWQAQIACYYLLNLLFTQAVEPETEG